MSTLNRQPKSPQLLTHALAAKVLPKLPQSKLAIFLDYDGTLTPTVSRPLEESSLNQDVRELLTHLATLHPIAIISGRDRSNVSDLVQLPQLIYAGSHGFDILGSTTYPLQHEVGQEFIPQIKQLFLLLQQRLNHIPAICLQEKKYALAVHYRNVESQLHATIIAAVTSLVQEAKVFKMKGGKDLIEICPNINWDKGQGMKWIAETLQLNTPEYFHIYIGDDITDEDAFRALPQQGMGILVGNHGQNSFADFYLNNCGEVKEFLRQLL